LGLLPGALTPRLQECAVRLGAWLPFRSAAALLAEFTGTAVDEATVRRRSEAAGAAYAAHQTAVAEALERDAPAPLPGPATLLVSVDGAMVPLVGGAWAEVKTLAVGVVQPPAPTGGDAAPRTAELSYFSRRAGAAEFARLAAAETHRRGVERAGRVAGVVDGAAWCQGFLDAHRPDATRILDFAHAAEYVARAGQAAGVAEADGGWLGAQLRELRHGDPDRVLAALQGLGEGLAGRPEARDAVAASLHYLAARRAQLAYAAFAAAGLPVGSGSVESANKLVVEARLKGGGMRWAEAHVDPMLALRNVVCNDRWAEAWPQMAAELRAAARRRSQQRRAVVALATPPPPPVPAPRRADPPGVQALPATRHDDLAPPPPPRRRASTAAHPWRRYGHPLNPRAA
jgi:hypothetical protein